jgi:hypothetical protein
MVVMTLSEKIVLLVMETTKDKTKLITLDIHIISNKTRIPTDKDCGNIEDEESGYKINYFSDEWYKKLFKNIYSR